MVVEKDGLKQVFFIGLWYHDWLVRTVRGWRIRERVERFSYAHNVTDTPTVPLI